MKAIASASIHSGDSRYHHDIETGGHRLVADEPESAGGGNAGPAPYELLLSGLGACTAITLRMYAEHKGWDLGKLSVNLSFLKDREGHERIERTLHANGNLDEDQWGRLLAVAEKTPVTLTIKRGTPIDTRRV